MCRPPGRGAGREGRGFRQSESDLTIGVGFVDCNFTFYILHVIYSNYTVNCKFDFAYIFYLQNGAQNQSYPPWAGSSASVLLTSQLDHSTCIYVGEVRRRNLRFLRQFHHRGRHAAVNVHKCLDFSLLRGKRSLMIHMQCGFWIINFLSCKCKITL